MIILYQKNYSVFQELYHSGIGRVKKKYLGRVRRGIVDKVKQNSRDQLALNIKANRVLKNSNDISDKNLARKLIREARDKGDARIFDKNEIGSYYGKSPNSYMFTVPTETKKLASQEYLDNKKYSPRVKRALKSMVDRKNIINLSGDYKDSVATLAHEIGHTMNNTGTAGKKKQIINRLASFNQNKKSEGVLDSIKKNYTELKEEKKCLE